MKKLLILAVLIGGGVWGYMKFGPAAGPHKDGVHIGASIAEVERVLGPAERVLPNFGQELRFYKGESGRHYMLTFKDDELIEIQ